LNGFNRTAGNDERDVHYFIGARKRNLEEAAVRNFILTNVKMMMYCVGKDEQH
jgi:hypothetical protein